MLWEGMIPARCVSLVESSASSHAADVRAVCPESGEAGPALMAGPVPRGARPAPCHLPLPVRVLGILRRKWACPILLEIERGTKRFGELARRIDGLRRPVLAAELHRLMRDGLIRKREVSKKPPEVHYSLTATGSSFCRMLHSLSRWEGRHLYSGRRGADVSDHFKMTGHADMAGPIKMST